MAGKTALNSEYVRRKSMKIGFNEGCNRFCENHSVLEDLDLCEK